MRKPVLLALLLVISLPLIASAEIREESFEINPFLGYCVSANSPEFCHKKIIGLRMGYNITKNWEVEGSYTKVESTAKLVGLGLLYHLTPDKRFTPFIMAGGGYGHVEPERNKSHYDTAMGEVGAGFKFAFNDNIALRSDIRDVVTHSNNVIITAGLTITLGGKTHKTAPVVETTTAAPKPEMRPEPKPEPKPEVKPAPVEEPKPAHVHEAKTEVRPEPVKVVLEDIHFANDKYSLTPAAKEILQGNIGKLKENPGMEIEIQGHTSAIGTDDYNLKLSIKRAETVKDYLIKEGIAAERLTAKGYGEKMPEVVEKKAKKESPAAKANRRVHFEIKIK